MTRFIRLTSPLFFLLTGAIVYAQQFFEGTVEYKVEMTGTQASMLLQNEPNNQLTMHISGGSYIVQLSGGRYPKTFLFLPDSNRQYLVDAEKKMVYKYSQYSDADSASRLKPVVPAVSTGRTEVVRGETCAIYEVKKPGETVLYYVSDKYFVNKTLFGPKTRANALFLVPGLDGRIPCRVVRKQDGLTITTELTKVAPRTFDPSLFLLPGDFEFKKRYYGY